MPHEDYFSIDAILSAEPRVYATFRVRGHLLGHLDPLAATLPPVADKENSPPDPNASNLSPPPPPGRDLRAGRRVALPFWLVESLAAREIVDVHTPHCYGARVKNDLLADAGVVNLSAKCGYYYALGLKIAGLVRDAGLVAMLLRALAERAWPAADAAAYGSAVGKGAEAMGRLENGERDLFFASHGSAVAMARWRERTGERLRPSSVLGKRKAALAVACSPLTPRNPLRRLR
jgi:GINS complex subunit 3